MFLPAMSEPSFREGAEVSRHALGFFRTVVSSRGQAAEELRNELARLDATREDYLEWTDIAGLYDLLDGIRESGESVAGLGAAVGRTPELGLFLRILRLVATPKLLFRLIFNWSGRRIFRHVDVAYSEESGGWIRVRMSIPERYRGCENFFRVCVGACRATPELLGLPDAVVEASTHSHFGEFRILPPPSMALWSRALRALRMVFTGRYLVDELTQQQGQLTLQYGELQRTLEQVEAERNDAEIAQRKAEEALAVRRTFLSRVNHELRTPLNGVVGALATLPADRELAESVHAARRSAQDLTELFEGLLRFSELSSGPATAVASEFELDGLIEEVIDDRGSKADAKGLKVALKTPPSRALLETDRRALYDSVWALVDNAVKFTDSGSVAISVMLEPGGSGVAIEVADTGVGIADNDVAELFDAFRQADESRRRERGGLGIGLAWAKRSIALLGGSIEVESALGEGALFRVRIPISYQRQDVEQPIAAKTGCRRVLICDDNATNRLVLTHMMAALGFEPTAVENGALGVEAFSSDRFDLVLMDCEMPVLDGYAATRQIRELPHGGATPVVAVTAYTGDDDRKECFDAGMDEFLPKPLRPAALRATLARLHFAPASAIVASC